MPQITWRLGVLLLTLWLLANGCGDDGTIRPTTGSVRGHITDIETGEPVVDALVLLLQPGTLETASLPASVDQDGMYAFTEVPPGEYVLVVYHDSLAIFDRSSPGITVEAGRETIHDVRMIYCEFLSTGPYHMRIQGELSPTASVNSPFP
jgi:hypothetical protein